MEHITECCMVGSWLRCLAPAETLCWEAAPFGSPGGSFVLQIPWAGAAGSLGSLPAGSTQLWWAQAQQPLPSTHPDRPQHPARSASPVGSLIQPQKSTSSSVEEWILDNTQLLCFKLKKKNKTQLVFLKIKLTQNLSIRSDNMIEDIRGVDPAGAYNVRLPQREIAIYSLLMISYAIWI